MTASPWDSLLLANVFIWRGIALCIIQFVTFPGLQSCNFQRQQFRLEVETVGGKRDASGLLALRKKSNLTLASVLWGNVAINVLLTLLPDSVLAGKPDARPKMARGSPGEVKRAARRRS
ncbi:MAG: hypothetical protein WB624_27105 [Xanthobacteraceae bacterium]|jgi:metal transporter CNNM